jgi:hypothetical protein
MFIFNIIHIFNIISLALKGVGAFLIFLHPENCRPLCAHNGWKPFHAIRMTFNSSQFTLQNSLARIELTCKDQIGDAGHFLKLGGALACCQVQLATASQTGRCQHGVGLLHVLRKLEMLILSQIRAKLRSP